MTEAYCRLSGGDDFEVVGAGLEQGVLNHYVVKALREDGIDMAGKGTQAVMDLWKAGRRFDYVVSVCSREAAERCPIFPGSSGKLHWPFEDPSTFTGSDDQIMKRVRGLRDAIKARVKQFVDEVRSR
jgi:arsenate reductase (thioredoxin)